MPVCIVYTYYYSGGRSGQLRAQYIYTLYILYMYLCVIRSASIKLFRFSPVDTRGVFCGENPARNDAVKRRGDNRADTIVKNHEGETRSERKKKPPLEKTHRRPCVLCIIFKYILYLYTYIIILLYIGIRNEPNRRRCTRVFIRRKLTSAASL